MLLDSGITVGALAAIAMTSFMELTGSRHRVAKLLADAGEACAAYHDEHVRGITGHRRIECDEVWSFVYAKERNLPRAKAAPKQAGDTWTFTAIDADSNSWTTSAAVWSTVPRYPRTA